MSKVDFPEAMRVRIVQPAAPLRGFISAYFTTEIDSPADITDFAPPEWGSLRIILDGAFHYVDQTGATISASTPYAQGPSTHPFQFSLRKCRLLSIGVLPEGFARLWNYPVGKIGNDRADLADVLGADTPVLLARLSATECPDEQFAIVDSYLLERVSATQPSRVSTQIARVHALINDPSITRADDIADALHISASTLTKLCKERFGFAPKTLLRRQRFLRMLDALHARPYSEWPDFVDPQYTDQSHMIRDFKYFMGMSPSQYLALPRTVQQASAVHRTAAIGSALQGLG